MDKTSKRRPLSQPLEVLAKLGELPDELTREEVIQLWHGPKWYAYSNHAAQATAVLLDRAIAAGEIGSIIPAVTRQEQCAIAQPFRGFGFGVETGPLPEWKTVEVVVTPRIVWIQRNAMRAWLRTLPAHLQPSADALLGCWVSAAGDQDIDRKVKAGKASGAARRESKADRLKRYKPFVDAGCKKRRSIARSDRQAAKQVLNDSSWADKAKASDIKEGELRKMIGQQMNADKRLQTTKKEKTV